MAIVGRAARRVADKGGLADIAADLIGGRIRNLGRWMRNRLQKAASSLSPWVDKLRMAFDRIGFCRASAFGQWIGIFWRLSPCATCTAVS